MSPSLTSASPTAYLDRPEGRVGYDAAGDGPLLVLVPGMGDLRAAYRFLAPALRDAGYRVASTDLRGHGDSDSAFGSYGHAKAFSLTTRTNHDPAEARLGEVAVPTLVVMGEQDPDFPDPAPRPTGSPTPCTRRS